MNAAAILTACLGSLLLLVWPCRSASITAQTSPLIVTAGDPNDIRYSVVPGSGYEGVGRLFVDRTNGGVGCTASLLESGRALLTAAHCVTDSSGSVNALIGEVTFVTASGEESILVTAYSVHPDWSGKVRAGADVAVLILAHPASSRVRRYGVYTGADELGAPFDFIGFGASGTGATGVSQDDGVQRRGRNTLDATVAGTLDRLPGWTAGSNVLLADFDDGSARHDALGFFFHIADLGLGLDEAIPAPGDSGGPGLVGGRIAAISSFATRLTQAGGTTSDIDSSLNWSTGEVTGFTRISSYSDWINSQAFPVPEPHSLSLTAVGLLACIFCRFRLRPPFFEGTNR